MLDSRVSKSVHSDTVDVIYAMAETVAVEPATLFYSASNLGGFGDMWDLGVFRMAFQFVWFVLGSFYREATKATEQRSRKQQEEDEKFEATHYF